MKGLRCILLIAALTAFTGTWFCKSNTTPPDKREQCGQCLDLPTGNVCTEQGTLKNNCMAICLGVKIECNKACPCPAK